MVLYTKITEACWQDASTHNLRAQLENLELQISNTQTLVGFTPFRPTCIIRKSMGRSFRLLAYDAHYEEDSLILLLRILPRSGNDYNWLLDNHETSPDDVDQRFLSLSEEEIYQIYYSKKQALKDSLEVIHRPSDVEQGWLYSVCTTVSANNEDLLVLESKEWIEEMISQKMRDFLGNYHGFLNEIDIPSLEHSSSIGDIKYLYDSTRKVGVLYAFFPEKNQLFLVFPFRDNKEENRIKRISNFREKFSSIREDEDQLVLRFSGRSYPFFMILDCDAWLSIQKNKEANLALSPEEGNLLKAVRSSNFESANYPLFINGRAGSGKSTILQYLMTDFVDFSLRSLQELHPLYMTYSADLLKSARDTVKQLLDNHSTYLLEGRIAAAEINKVLDCSFVVFHDFLLNLLPSDLTSKFSKGKFVSFAEFQRLWATPQGFGSRPEARKINPGTAWHIIRSYIKGIRSGDDDDLSPEEFSALPKKQRSVTFETYKFVYEKVWLTWYKPLNENEGYWDDQDLVANILASGILRSLNYAAILCDEAQDFTSIELEFILQLSVFSKRKIHSVELRRVPFIFAGDPLQTLNPTGFRWESIQADFYDRFCSVLDPYQRSNAEITYRELMFNYRSNRGIVDFCNLIQLLRLSLIGGANIHPQKAWWVEEPVHVIWFDVNDVRTQEQLSKNPEIVKIVNCDLGDETKFVQENPILQGSGTQEENIYQNILSSSRSKGLEFTRVVLYCFGESAPSDFKALLNGEINVHNDSEKCLEYEYFLNRLYVAASRAKKQLIIVDSRQALEGFWKFATNPDLVSKLAEQLRDFSEWQDKLAYLLQGSYEAWTGETVDIRAQANEYEMQGVNLRDPYLLRQAALSFRSIGEQIKSVKCFATALELENRFQDAGDTYKQSDLYSQAFDSYWSGACFSSIQQLVIEYPSLSGNVKSRAADFMSQPKATPQALIAELFSIVASESGIKQVLQDKTWHLVIQEISQRLLKTVKDKGSHWINAYNVLETCCKKGVEIDSLIMGKVAYRANQFDKASEYFEASGNIETEEYFEVQAELKQFPEKLKWLRKLNGLPRILEECAKHPELSQFIHTLDRDTATAIFDAAIDKGNHQLALLALQNHCDTSRVARFVDSAISRQEYMLALELLQTRDDLSCIEDLVRESIRHQQDIASSALTLLLKSLIQNRQWAKAIELVNGRYKIRQSDSRFLEQYLNRREDVTRLLIQVAVDIFARSTELSEETSDNQSHVSEFLYQRFIAQRPYLSIQAAGLRLEVVSAAIERAGKIVNAVRFYESMQNFRGLPEDEAAFVNERLVAALERYASYLRGTNQSHQAEDREFRAQELRNRLEMGARRFSEYPEISDEATYADEQQNSESETELVSTRQTEWEHGPLVCRYSLQHNRWRVEHRDLFESVTFSLSDLTMRGDAEFECIATRGRERVIWNINGWDTQISVSQLEGGLEIRITTGDAKSLRIPA